MGIEKEGVMGTKTPPNIKEIMREFDFGKVAAVMHLLQWKWAKEPNEPMEVPTIQEIKKEAKRLLLRATELKGTISCGGFKAGFHDSFLTLEFVVEEWSAR